MIFAPFGIIGARDKQGQDAGQVGEKHGGTTSRTDVVQEAGVHSSLARFSRGHSRTHPVLPPSKCRVYILVFRLPEVKSSKYMIS